MVAKGGPKPKFVNPADKHAVSEGENGFITFTVEGNPAPSVEWFKGFKDLSVEPRSVKLYCGASGAWYRIKICIIQPIYDSA